MISSKSVILERTISAYMQAALQDKLVEALKPYDPLRIGVFGSYARDEQKRGSDLDVLIRFKNRIGLLRLVQIQQELSDLLGIDVDLVTENSIKNPRLKKYIEKDLITIYQWKRTN